MWELPAVEHLIKIGLALALGGFIGFEREWADKPAGIRTHILVCLAACVVTILALDFENTTFEGQARIIEGLIVGIGFLGAGTIISSGGGVKGLTTAASVWTTTGIGITVGAGKMALAVIAAVAVFVVLRVGKAKHRLGD
ncbi:MAG: MgtC/SapB family protein [Candidatus Thermoplasmatota archaeon]|nr:MgtC/SapB family protein [Candidatus Thermoplasmatota archaeon]